MNGPFDVGIDSGGNMFLAHVGPVLKVDAGGNFTSVGSTSADRIAIGPQDRVIGSVSRQILLYSASGGPVALGGGSSCGYGGDGGPARSALFNSSGNVIADAGGDIFVAGRFNRRVRRIQAHVAPSAPPAATPVARRTSANTPWPPPSSTAALPVGPNA